MKDTMNNLDNIQQESFKKSFINRFNTEKLIVGTVAYQIDQDIQKGISEDEILEKARTGYYVDNSYNRKHGLVGKPYKKKTKQGEEKEEGVNEENMDKSVDSIISSIKSIDEVKSRLKEKGYNESHPYFKKVENFRNDFIDKSNKIVRNDKGKNVFDFKIDKNWYSNGQKASLVFKVGMLKNHLYDKHKDEFREQSKKYPNGFSSGGFYAKKLKNEVESNGVKSEGGESNYSESMSKIYVILNKEELD